jgi:nucleotide-binding universal stress UspA family protein
MAFLKNILFPTDFSVHADNALPYAVDLIKRNNGKFSLLNVYGKPMLDRDAVLTTDIETESESIEDTRPKSLVKLKQIIADNDLSGYQHRCFLREGKVVKQILKIIKQNPIHLVVMGTNAAGEEKGLFTGSLAQDVLQHAYCPVLAVPKEASFGNISKIVYATDLLANESPIINYVIGFAELYDAMLILLHIDRDEDNKEWSMEALKNIVNKTKYSNIAYKEIVKTDVAEGINGYLEEQKVDVLAMTTRTTSFFNQIFHNSLTTQTLLSTHIPLLVFNRKKYDTVFLG